MVADLSATRDVVADLSATRDVVADLSATRDVVADVSARCLADCLLTTNCGEYIMLW